MIMIVTLHVIKIAGNCIYSDEDDDDNDGADDETKKTVTTMLDFLQ
jgi:hypothetical protein